MHLSNRNILRHDVLASRNKIKYAEQYSMSNDIFKNLCGLQEFKRANTTFIYMHFRSEVKTAKIINHCFEVSQTVTIPHTLVDEKKLLSIQIKDQEKDVISGYCGIPEPIDKLVRSAVFDPQKIDIAIIPGSLFDRNGGRLGYGGGYYDRFLADQAPNAVRAALAYEVQVVEKVPLEAHDQLMDFVITEKNIYDCRGKEHA